MSTYLTDALIYLLGLWKTYIIRLVGGCCVSVSRAFSLRLHRPPCMLAVTRTSQVQSAPRPIRRARNDVPTGRKNQAAVSPEAIIIEKKRFSIHMSSHCDCIRVFRECKREIKWLVWGSKKRHKKTHFRDTFWSPLADTIYMPANVRTVIFEL